MSMKQYLDNLRGKVTLVDHLCSCVVKDNNGVSMGSNLRFKGLVLLNLGLKYFTRFCKSPFFLKNGQLIYKSEKKFQADDKSYLIQFYKRLVQP